MKKIILAYLLIVITLIFGKYALAQQTIEVPTQDQVAFLNPAIVGGGVPAAGGGDCPAGTYDGSWDGDHSSGTGYLCIDDGGSAADASASAGGTMHTDYGEGGGTGYRVTDDDQYYEWTNADAGIDVVGTLCVRFNAAIGGGTVRQYIGGIHNETYNDDHVGIAINSDDTVYGIQRADTTADGWNSTATITRGTWSTACITWRINAGNDEGVALWTGATPGTITWESFDTDDIGDFAAAPTHYAIGNTPDFYSAGGETFDINKIFFGLTWEAKPPW